MVIINNCEDNAITSEGATSDNVVGMVSQRVSSRLRNQPKNYWGNDDNKRIKSGTDEDHNIGERTKLKNTCSHSINSSDNSLVFDKQDFEGILKIKKLLRDTNIYRLQSDEINVEKSMSELKGCDNLIKKLRRVAINVNKLVAEGQISRAPSIHPLDLSYGLEAIPIPVTNEIDDSPITPIDFTYITSIQVAKNVKVPSSDDYGCQCKGNSCRINKTCCFRLNNMYPYVRRGNCSRLVGARDIVFECGPRCGCGPDCGSRVSQKGLQYQLEVYRTSNKGWAVRTRNFIPIGALVCEVVGVLKRTEDLENASHNDYIIEIDCWETIKEIGGRKKRLPDEPLPAKIFLGQKDDETTKNEPEFCIDCSSFGNVARFINHSCDPNLFVQCVLNSHYGVKQARLVLFAGRNIRPKQELTYDYGYRLDSVVDADGKIKQLPCYCGEATCRKRLY
ncbi:Histone-lysine N-methyltransferase, H3 lysine-9 specific SUVH4 [Glycine max]|nr:Histone-lysine N-methyltransferase, H3 lysine-9 specific SUVH4 [Glycine max]